MLKIWAAAPATEWRINMYIGGLDVGTTGCKLSVYDSCGKFIKNTYCEYKSERNDTVQQINAAAVWEAVKQVIKTTMSEIKIEVIGVTSFGESFVMLDKEDNILMPSMLYTDKRGSVESKLFDGINAEKITGAKPHGMYSLAKIMWVKNNMPEIYDKTTRIHLFQDFIVYKLTGKAQIDYSLACRTMGFDIKNKCWSKKIFDIAGIDINKMAIPVPSGTVAGKIISPEFDAENVTVVTGCHDQLAALIGAGITELHTAIDGTGTVECITPVLDKIPDNTEFYEMGYTILPHILRDKYVCYAFSFTGGAALKWYRDNFISEESYKEADKKIKEKPTGILIMPHFAGAATPYMDENSKAVFTGITLGTDKYDIYKAIMEGVTYEMLLNLEKVEKNGIIIDKLYATGGGANSSVWLQIKADILNKEIIALDAPEAGAMGTVMLAGNAVGAFESMDSARKIMVKEKKHYYPDEEKHDQYMQYYKKYKYIYDFSKKVN